MSHLGFYIIWGYPEWSACPIWCAPNVARTGDYRTRYARGNLSRMTMAKLAFYDADNRKIGEDLTVEAGEMVDVPYGASMYGVLVNDRLSFLPALGNKVYAFGVQTTCPTCHQPVPAQPAQIVRRP